MTEANNKFDLDLKDGMIAEKQMLRLLGTCKIEVKNDYFLDKTGNIAIEYRCWGKPSGISVTEADWYAIFLGNAKAEICVLIKVEALKALARTFFKNGSVKKGGDQDQSEFILVPWSEIIKLSNYGEESKRWKEHRQE